MAEGSGPSTRFRATELLPGCANCTDSLRPMLKLCQLMAAFCDVCVITVERPDVVIVAVPAETAPPLGAAWLPSESDIAAKATAWLANAWCLFICRYLRLERCARKRTAQKNLTAWIQKR